MAIKYLHGLVRGKEGCVSKTLNNLRLEASGLGHLLHSYSRSIEGGAKSALVPRPNADLRGRICRAVVRRKRYV
jgi:hypothetical protein